VKAGRRSIGLVLIAGAAAAGAIWPGAAWSEDLRDLCTDRPGLGTPACTIDRNHVAVELGLGDWTLDREAGGRTDAFITGDVTIRYGLGESLEAQLSWQALGLLRERDAAGSVDHPSGTGDVRIALRQNLHNPDGSGFSIAIMPYVTLPTGGGAIGAGGWQAGVLLPVSYALTEDTHLSFTGEIDNAADEQGGGHHLAYSGVAGLDAPLAENLSGAIEIEVARDEATGQHSTEWLTGVSLAWLARKSFQVDAGANIGLNRQAPDLQLYLGIVKRF